MRLTMRNALIAALLLCTSGLYGDSDTGRSATSAWTQNLLAWRSEHAKSLDAPDGWLALVDLAWLRTGDNPFGSAPDNWIRIAGPVPAHLGILRLDHDSITLLAPPAGFPEGLLLDGRPPAAGRLSASDHPDHLSDGTFSMFVIHRGDRYALRIRNSQAAARIHFQGLRWYAPDPRYRIRARWIPYAPEKHMKIPTVIGTTLDVSVPGRAELTLDGRQVSLEPIVESGNTPRLLFILRDSTSRTTTYGASRFLYTGFPDHGLNQPGDLWLDFNRLENPPCAYTPYATCPLPPRQNRLSVAIPAGEQRYVK
jgi:uncharacterized protein (DUF1684 family)